MKFTKEEISLCKQVVERHRKEICKGDCVAVRSYGDLSGKTEYKVKLVDAEFLRESLDVWFPLWTISDCLEFLREREPQLEFELVFGDERKVIFHWTKTYTGKTPLEACLKAVLAVLVGGV